ncbi:MAG TPA: hypothetical protein VK335_12290 [Bryobacteraceae bacterium]|nr:hypothetical protein [Bryobacteraceae bacterium]
MKRAALPVFAGLMVTGVGFAQDLPPGVLVLSRTRDHIKEELQRLENISCLETVQREHQPPTGKMRPLDTVRLEVLFDGHKEFFTSPGGRKFSEENPISYVGSGMIGTGVFGGYLTDALLNASVSVEYKGEEEIAGRRRARYDYRLPLLWSRNTIQIVEGSGTVGMHGSYWVDPRTYDVVRLEVVADDIPPTLPITEAVTSIEFAPTRVSDHVVVLLPESAELRIAKFTGEIDHNRMEFTHCRAFGVESTINFGADSADETPRFGVSSVDDTLRTLPTGLQIAVKLRNGISGDMAVGAVIDGVIDGDLMLKHRVVIAAGSPVLGRIRRLERYTDPFPYFVVALEFTEVQVQGIRYRFYADPVDIERIAGVEQRLGIKDEYETRSLLGGGSSSKQRKESLFLPDLPGVAVFFFKGAKLDLPQGFRTEWKTRQLKP